MTRNKSRHCCVVCFREYSVNSPTNEVRQPDNPRRVFKVCSSYLKPEVFTKYSKWDLFSDLERQSPFCAMCSKSGEKLSALNDKLEEVQREIKSYLKYFVKEIRLCRGNDDEDMTEDENESKDDQNPIPSNIPLEGNYTQPFQIVINKYPSENIANAITIKEEIPEQEYYISDNEYFPISEGDEDDEEDEDVPRKSIIKRSKSESNPTQNQDWDPESESPKESMKNATCSIIHWREIQISPEEVEEKWSLKQSGNPKSKWLKTAYFYCKIGGKRCPVRLKKKEATGKLGFHFYDNSRQHVHLKKSFGVSKSIEREVQNIYEEGNPESAKPAFIMEALEAQGMKIRKKQLHNLMTKLGIIRNERLGLLPPKEESDVIDAIGIGSKGATIKSRQDYVPENQPTVMKKRCSLQKKSRCQFCNLGRKGTTTVTGCTACHAPICGKHQDINIFCPRCKATHQFKVIHPMEKSLDHSLNLQNIAPNNGEGEIHNVEENIVQEPGEDIFGDGDDEVLAVTAQSLEN